MLPQLPDVLMDVEMIKKVLSNYSKMLRSIRHPAVLASMTTNVH
jgi:hypothetical protein